MKSQHNDIGLSANTIAHIQQVFINHPHIEKAILYGSRAMGNYRHGSDIDLTLLGNKLTQTELYDINKELDDLPIAYTIDISLFDSIENNELKAHIKRVGNVFFEKEPI